MPREKEKREKRRKDTTGEKERVQELGLEKSSQLRCYIIQIADP